MALLGEISRRRLGVESSSPGDVLLGRHRPCAVWEDEPTPLFSDGSLSRPRPCAALSTAPRERLADAILGISPPFRKLALPGALGFALQSRGLAKPSRGGGGCTSMPREGAGEKDRSTDTP